MKRHEALVPLSREHHHLLILAQVLKHDVPAYPNMPTTPAEQRAYALARFDDLLSAHFRWEEEAILPLAERYGDKLCRLANQVRTDHAAIRTAFDNLKTATDQDLPQQLDALGHQLAAYLDHGTEPMGHGAWSLTEGSTRTWGLDLGRCRVRLVADRVEGRTSTGWGLI